MPVTFTDFTGILFYPHHLLSMQYHK